MTRPEYLPEKVLRSQCIAGSTEHEINGVPVRIDRPIEIMPLLVDLNRGLIDAVRILICRWEAPFMKILPRAVPEQMYGLQFTFPWWTGASQPHVPYIRVKTAIGFTC